MAFKAGTIILCGAALAAPTVVMAADGERFDPYATIRTEPYYIDMQELLANPGKYVAEPVEQPDLSKLGSLPVSDEPGVPGKLPPGWVQIGEVVMREEIALGLKEIDPEPSPAWEDIEGNQYPRKGTVYLNFLGGMLLTGADNSAENKSTLAKHKWPYPGYAGSESSALALVQAIKEDMATLGVRILYDKRPSKTVPYTMAMIGGSWTDTNIGDPAGGVAPGTDCEDRGQRNVVYAFDTSSATVSQEVAHAWGLDHTMGSDRIMSYQNGTNKHFGDNCQPLCEDACQGPGSIGCRLTHEIYCGVGSETQNDLAELNKIFGGPEPDTEPPTVEIAEPVADNGVLELPDMSSVNIVAKIHDNYGGVGWKITISKDGMVVKDEVDYDRVGTWYLANMPEGTYEVILEAEDHADHVVQDKLTIIVGTPADPTTGGGSGTDTDTGSDTDAGGSSGGGSATSGPGGDKEGGCECSARGEGGLGALGLPLLGLLWAHRARRRRR